MEILRDLLGRSTAQGACPLDRGRTGEPQCDSAEAKCSTRRWGNPRRSSLSASGTFKASGHTGSGGTSGSGRGFAGETGNFASGFATQSRSVWHQSCLIEVSNFSNRDCRSARNRQLSALFPNGREFGAWRLCRNAESRGNHGNCRVRRYCLRRR